MNTVLHKQDDDFAIVTSAESEADFRGQFTQALATMVDEGNFEGDWAFHLDGWLDPAIEIICSYRGYKAQVTKRSTIIAGALDPDAAVVAVGRQAVGVEALQEVAAA